MDSSELGNIVSAMTMLGGSFSQLGLLSLGVIPYITASIIMQLMKVVSPRIEEMNQIDSERNKLTQWTRYLAVGLAIMQSVGIVVGAPQMFGFQIFSSDSIIAKIIAVFSMVVGAIIAMRIGEEITIRGISNGISLVIFTSILVTLPGLITGSYTSKGATAVTGFILLVAAVLALVVFVEHCEYPVRVIYTSSSGKTGNSYGKLPIKVAIAGVLPVIFASSLVNMPLLLSQFYPRPWTEKLAAELTYGTVWYNVAFLSLTVFFTFFSVMLVFDVKQVTRNMRVQGGFIPGVRPGKDTENFISDKANKMAGISGVYLVVISLVTLILFPKVGLANNGFGATSIIILSTVVVTLITAIEAGRTNKSLRGFLR